MKQIDLTTKLTLESMKTDGSFITEEVSAIEHFIYINLKAAPQFVPNMAWDDLTIAASVLNKFRAGIDKKEDSLLLETAEHALLIKILKGALPKMPMIQAAIVEYVQTLEKLPDVKVTPVKKTA